MLGRVGLTGGDCGAPKLNLREPSFRMEAEDRPFLMQRTYGRFTRK
jgi:hypothetical protein